MLAFPGMLVPAAQEANMKVPSDPDSFNPKDFPHFDIFCTVQLGRRMSSWTEHWDNAKVVAALTEAECKTITLGQLLEKGLSFST